MSMVFHEKSIRLFILISLIISWLFYNFQTNQPINKANLSLFTQDTIKANQLEKEAEKLYDEGRYEAAIERYDTAKVTFKIYKLWKKVIDCDLRAAAIADNIDVATKDFYARESLNKAKKYLSKDDFQLGKAYQQVAEVAIMKEHYDSSIAYFNIALDIFKQQEKWDFLCWAIISKSINYYYKEDLKSFEKGLLLAQEYAQKYDLDREIYISTLELLAFVYEEEGDFEKAIKNTKNSIDYYLQLPKISISDSFSIANNYINISQHYSSIGAFQKAINYNLEAIRFSDYNSFYNYLNALSSICSDLYAAENYQESITYGHRALNIIDKVERNEQLYFATYVYDLIGLSFMHLNSLDSSAYYLKLAINKPYNKYTHYANIDYAKLLLEQSQTDKALNILIKQLKTDVDKVLYFTELGQAYSQKGDFDKALLYVQKSLHLRVPSFVDTLNPYENPVRFGQMKSPIFLLQDLKIKANILSQFPKKQKNLEAALETYDVAFQLMDTLLQKYAFDDSRMIHNRRNREIYEQAIEVAMKLYTETAKEKYIHKAFAYAEKIKSNILLADLQIDDSQAVIPKQLQEQERILVANVLFYERQLATATKDSATAKIKLYQNYLSNYRFALGELKDSIRNIYPKYYSLKYSSTLATIPAIQTGLKPQQAFISYYSGDSTTYVFTITNKNIAFEKLGKTNTIAEQVFAFRNVLKAPGYNNLNNDFENYNQISNQLYKTLLANNIANISNEITQLTIIPDGSLSHIPFEILTNKITTTTNQDFSKMPYLLYNYQIQYGYSATLLRENKKRQNQIQPNSKCLAYAPIYKTNDNKQRGIVSNLRNGNITQLQNTSKEIASIATYFDGDFNQTETATKANFLKEAPSFGMLHLAMHGEANYEKEQFANLKFSNTKSQSKEDYLLYQGEIANMNLDAQLVVLSACETGVGKYIYGEGIASLGRSFMYAGVPSIVMSLWKVDDKATSQLMPYFYENLAAGMAKDKALHEAKLTFLRKEDFSKLHPHYWAAFVSIGDTQPIKNSTNRKCFIFSIVLIFMAIAFFYFRNRNKS